MVWVTMRVPTEDRAAGALLGLAVGEALNGTCTPAHPGAVVAPVLAIAELLARDARPHEGELARLIIDECDADTRYGRHLAALFAHWEAGMPFGLAAAQTSAALAQGSDLAAALAVPVALASASDRAACARQVRTLAGITHADPVSVDAAVVVAASVALAVLGDPADIRSRDVVSTVVLREALERIAQLAEAGLNPAAVCEHVERGSRAADAVPTALFCVAGALTFEDGLARALDATTGQNAVPAIVGAICGARLGAHAIPAHLSGRVEPAVAERARRSASLLAAAGSAS